MCSQQSKGAKYPQKSFNCADAFSIKITRFHAALKPIFRSLKPFQAFSSLLNLGARDFSFYMNTHNGVSAQVHKKRLVRLTGRARQHRALAHYLIDGGPAVHTAVMQPPGLVIQLQRGQIFRTVDLQQKKRRVSRGDGRIFPASHGTSLRQ